MSAVKERPELIEETDEAILVRANAERRALLTENIRHLKPMVERWQGEEREHFGVVFASSRSFPRHQRMVGRLVAALDQYLDAHPREDELRNTWDWLAPPSND